MIINKVILYFEKFSALFHQPISTTTSFSKAQEFSQGIGIILTLKAAPYSNPSQAPRFLSVSWLSDFSGEEERIFYGKNVAFDIVNIREASNLKSHQMELSLFNKFQRLIQNEKIEWKKDQPEQLVKFIEQQQKYESTANDANAMNYGKGLFNCFCRHRNTITVKINDYKSLNQHISNSLIPNTATSDKKEDLIKVGDIKIKYNTIYAIKSVSSGKYLEAATSHSDKQPRLTKGDSSKNQRLQWMIIKTNLGCAVKSVSDNRYLDGRTDKDVGTPLPFLTAGDPQSEKCLNWTFIKTNGVTNNIVIQNIANNNCLNVKGGFLDSLISYKQSYWILIPVSTLSIIPLLRLFPYLQTIELNNIDIDEMIHDINDYPNVIMEYIEKVKTLKKRFLKQLSITTKQMHSKENKEHFEALKTKFNQQLAEYNWTVKYNVSIKSFIFTNNDEAELKRISEEQRKQQEVEQAEAEAKREQRREKERKVLYAKNEAINHAKKAIKSLTESYSKTEAIQRMVHHSNNPVANDTGSIDRIDRHLENYYRLLYEEYNSNFKEYCEENGFCDELLDEDI